MSSYECEIQVDLGRISQHRRPIVRRNASVSNYRSAQAERQVRGIFVIFDRGWQTGNLYFDPAVFRFAARHQFGLLLAQHCPSKGSEDIDVVPANGIGRALITALDQLASASQHPELSKSSLIHFGFSGAGSLTARMIEFVPERTIAAIEFAPGQGDPVGMDSVQIGRESANGSTIGHCQWHR